MSGIEELRARVEELERRIEILFNQAGALDVEELGRDASEPSAEVRELAAQGRVKKAVELYQRETGADTPAAMGAIAKLRDGG
jgi:hypothetical protein